MKVDYVDHMGSDDAVVDAARVSFAKQADNYKSDQNQRLLNYLAKHDHWSPFAHCMVKFRIKAPICVARQLAKHQVGFAWNEVSRRYVDDPPQYVLPDWRQRSEDKKQGSAGPVSEDTWGKADAAAVVVMDKAMRAYDELLELGIAPEQARYVLPQGVLTEWVWTGSLLGWLRVMKLRCAQDTQEETRFIANEIAGWVTHLFPMSVAAFHDPI